MVKEWQKSHNNKEGKACKLQPGAVGDLEHYEICPTGVGDFISVHCACGAELDLNDYEAF